ncbi:DNA polymerase/3'-5' exonuclease PolX [uncultured Methanomethylovorans sp.]|uniref:DNA polymerase/3'-5' exonuclease PolX n=1 Tax=uncultured Methanomethylovorans sp. TaxID=183759 RepID=UPI002AA93DCB|nr:DNA polymerase/3'-5' exonuclease PolX [uncultured Methanomethylovorans sp.]
MDNAEIAKRLFEMAEMLQFKGENIFKIKAYQKAARHIEELEEDINVLRKKDELGSIPGVGDAIEDKIKEMLDTGTFKAFEAIRHTIPEEIDEITAVQGIGPKTAHILYTRLGVKDLEGLLKAAEEHRIRRIPGMGLKTEENILIAAKRQVAEGNMGRFPLGTALSVAEEISKKLVDGTLIREVQIAGSIRRWKDTVGDIDLIARSDEPEKAIEVFTLMDKVQEVLEKGNTKGSIIYKDNIQVDLRIVKDDAFGSLLQYFTGSKEHNVKLRKIALSKGLHLSEYGLIDAVTGKQIPFSTEHEQYGRLGLQFIPPELREDRGEIEAAMEKKIPRLIEVSDIKGDLHVHSNWSDGQDTIEELALAAKALGYEYLNISDHSGYSKIANGLSEKRLLDHIKEIERLNESIEGIRIFSGTECDILPDGTLDYSDELLEQLDIVVVAVHGSVEQDSKTMTQRIVAALENENVHVLAHPTGRKFGKRLPFMMDMEKIMDTALEHGKVLEINSAPQRLDLNDSNAIMARKRGIKMAINTDTHLSDQFYNIRYGVGTARRAWLKSDDVINTLHLKDICKLLGIS